jgi:hypothetical protein
MTKVQCDASRARVAVDTERFIFFSATSLSVDWWAMADRLAKGVSREKEKTDEEAARQASENWMYHCLSCISFILHTQFS